ncbi:MAG: carboxymuconolactone decarboxylase family protein [Bacillota bacterium]
MISEREAGPLAPIFAEIRERMALGVVPAVFRAMAGVGTDVLTQNWTAYRETVLEGHLPRSLKEMVGLVVARAGGCPYGIGLYSRGLAVLGISAEVISSLAECGDAAHLSLRERAVVRFAESYHHGAGDDLSQQALESFGLSDDEVAEVSDAVLLSEGLCRFAREVGLTAEEI